MEEWKDGRKKPSFEEKTRFRGEIGGLGLVGSKRSGEIDDLKRDLYGRSSAVPMGCTIALTVRSIDLS